MGNYIVLDLEWNQASTKNKEKKGIMFEILEIGAVKLDENKNYIDEFDSLIKPQVYKTLHYMTKEIVNFDLNKMRNERPFTKVMKDFLDWCGDDFIFCTWGTSDMTELQRNMDYYKMEALSDKPLMYLDIQKLYSMEMGDGKTRSSLEHAVDFLSIHYEDEFHRAITDAKYTAKVFEKLKCRDLEAYVSYDTFHLPTSKSKEIHTVFPTYTKYISRAFKNKRSAMADREVSSIKCSICNSNCKKVMRWFTPNGGKYFLNIGQCLEHGYIKAKARMKKTSGDTVYVVKTIKPISAEMFDAFKEHYDKTQKVKSSNSDL